VFNGSHCKWLAGQDSRPEQIDMVSCTKGLCPHCSLDAKVAKQKDIKLSKIG
jgi:hypothetical protein